MMEITGRHTPMRELNKYHWELEPAADALVVQALRDALDIPEAGARFLAARGMSSPESARAYLFSDDIPPHDPFLFENMEQAVAAVRTAIDGGKNILVHGDYDVDGISGTALLYEYLGGIAEVSRFVPNRRRDGYGVADRAVDWAIEKGVDLMIAVDCGTSDGDKIERLESAGIGVVVCDHHELPVDRSVRGILLNPVRPGEVYPFGGLCGTGVAFKLTQALAARGIEGSVRPEDLLDLVALATVGDLSPLVDENRLFVRAGLRRMNAELRPGLAALKRAARVQAPELASSHLGFVIAPRINAPGRVDNPKPALELLCATDTLHLAGLADRLETENTHRRELTDKVQREALARIRENPEWRGAGGFILGDRDWDEGVLGIAAARVVDEFARPALLMSFAGDMAKGSGRSVRGVHLKEQLDFCEAILSRYGGHAQAVGFSLAHDKVDEFRDTLLEQFKRATADLPERPRLHVDADLPLEECTLELVDFFRGCEPFGMGNRTPVWRIRGVTITHDTRFVGGDHLKIHFRDDRKRERQAISFNWSQRPVTPRDLHNRRVDLAATVKKGFFNGKHYADIHVLDIRESEG